MQNQDRCVVRSSNEGRRIVTPIGYRRSARIANERRDGKQIDRQRVGESLIAPYRVKRATPRMVKSLVGGGEFEVWEDPAPDWVWKLVGCMMRRVGGETDDGRAIVRRALRWCEIGTLPLGTKPEDRSKILRYLIGDRSDGTFGVLRRGLGVGPRLREVRQLLDTYGAPGEPRDLMCPACFAQHIDRGVWAENIHRTHRCEACGIEWQPFVWATRGVYPKETE